MAYNDQKAKLCVDFCTDTSPPGAVVRAAIISEPMDAMSARLQHTDEAGGSYFEMTDEAGIVASAQRHSFGLLHPGHFAAPLASLGAWTLLSKHFGSTTDSCVPFFAETMYIAGQVVAGDCVLVVETLCQNHRYRCMTDRLALGLGAGSV